ncbi:MAG: hypothetical protein OXF41_20865 [bacterium]|nr:hypothetical protein [bacterium]
MLQWARGLEWSGVILSIYEDVGARRYTLEALTDAYAEAPN